MRLIRHPQIRFEHSYSGVFTVLEGAELSDLFENFFRHIKSKRKKTHDFWERMFLSVCRSYESVHGTGVLSEVLELLKDKQNPIRDADARKFDLFYRGMLRSLLEVGYPDRDWQIVFENQKSTHDIAKDIASRNLDLLRNEPDMENIINELKDNPERSKD